MLLSILHTNDFHNHFSMDQASYLSKRKAELAPSVLLLDAGDAVAAGNIGVTPAGETILKTMSSAGYDAMTLGNREFHVVEAALKHKIGNAQFPILSGNMRRRSIHETSNDAATLSVKPYIVLEVGEVSVGIVGVTVPMVTERMAARHISSFIFDEPVESAAQYAHALRDRVDVLIALTHIGIQADRRLAAQCPLYDLIISGHTHLSLEASSGAAGDVPIVQAGWFGRQYGLAQFHGSPGSRPTLSISKLYDLPGRRSGRT